MNKELVALSELMSTARKAAMAAASIIQAAAEKPKQVDFKGTTDLVTETDRESEKLVKDIISRDFPGHDILAEESGSTGQSSDYLWVIDPLDGTTNFVHGYPSYAVSIAVLYDDLPVVGIIIELPAGNVYSAIKGQGALCNNKPISVSTLKDLNKSLLVTGFGYEHGENWETNMKIFREFTDITQGVRRLGAAAVDLAHVACGKVDGYWEFDLNPWDCAAGVLLVEEAGGRVSRYDGGKFSIYSDQVLASNGKLHESMQGVLKKY